MSSAPKYNPHYTVADYLQWDGDWELWNGTAVSMSPSPFGPHERAAAKLVAQIDAAIMKNKCPCSVYANLDWIVSEDTVIRPDVMLVCGSQPERHLEKAPSLVVEVLSESTRLKDETAKLKLYENQGVEHYLLADPDEQSIRWLALQPDGTFQENDTTIDDGRFNVSLKNGCSIAFDREAIFAPVPS